MLLRALPLFVLAFAVFQSPLAAWADLAANLRELNSRVIAADDERAGTLPQLVARDTQSRMQAANERENEAWAAVQSRADWEAYRDRRLAALRRSLGEFPTRPEPIKVRVTRTIAGDGFRIQNIVYASRPGLLVTANLYLPAQPGAAMPAIVISHSQHNPKHQGELQDLGMTWARAGSIVLVPDVLGHGERRQHPFTSSVDYPQPFAVGRQDYYFRYIAAQQLHVAGESLVGWMVWDLLRAVDVVLAQPGVDKDRVILLGSVAGGGDPAGIAAALDPRIAAVAPFNFGGPQPDYPIPEDAARDFYFFGVPTWESTRCLRLGARDGFSHWMIVSAVAPRRLIYAHEFGWDEARDPAWPRMRRVFGFYDKPEHLTVAHGSGNLKGRPPEHTHCNNIGALHRGKFYPALERWFAMAPPQEYEQRRATEELTCLTPAAAQELQPKLVHQLAADIARERVAAARRRLSELEPAARRRQLQQDWARLLGDVQPRAAAQAVVRGKPEPIDGATVERLELETEPGLVAPALLLHPARQSVARPAVIVAVAQEGKQAFLQQRSALLAEWLRDGKAVCLVDVRGTGETSAGSRHWRGGATATSQHEQMLGQTLLGARLRDLRSVMQYLLTRTDLDQERLYLWGDSFSPPNAPERDLQVPLDAITEKFPTQAEPLGALLALLGGLFDDRVAGILAQGGLIGYQSLLQAPFVYVPHDAVIPGALAIGDLNDLAAALAPRALCLDRLVDGQNRHVPAETVATQFAPTVAAYRASGASNVLHFGDAAAAKFFLETPRR